MAKQKHSHYNFDLVIIGSGSGGGVAAHIAASYGKKVALIEKNKLGGECINYACIPTKALLESAKIYNISKDAPRYGVRATSLTFNYRSVKAWKDAVVRASGVEDSAKAFKSEGITVLQGQAYFIDKHTVSIGDRRIRAAKFIISTGSRTVIPPIPGLRESGFITSREAVDLTQPPRSVFIIGGGAVACEFAELFSTFGSRVHLADIAPRLLVREDPDASKVVEDTFHKKGVNIHLSSQVVEVSGGKGRKTVTYKTGNETHTTTVEEVLLAAGKSPSTDLGLDNAGVKFSFRGAHVNHYLQTSQKHIYAVGDVTGEALFTHIALYQARIASHNLFHSKKVRTNYHATPRVTFTDPEVASVGMDEKTLQAQHIPYQVGMTPISVIGRSLTSGHTTGFVKVYASHTGVLLGGTIVGLRAGEMIHELSLAVHTGTKADKIADMIHAFPTWSEGLRVACSKIDCL